jgi:hypothetical protein
VRAAKVPKPAPATWDQPLIDAVNTSGRLSAAYTAFHDYSAGNQLLALLQACSAA